MAIYSKAKDDADNDLEFKLRRSIQLVKEQQMAGKKSTSSGKKKSERATVSRERRLALALKALVEAIHDAVLAEQSIDESITSQAVEANNELNSLGYGSLIGIPKRLKELNELLKSAIEAEDGELIADIGRRMHLVKQGKDPRMKEKTDAASA